MRRALLATIVFAVPLLTTGCTVPVHGAAGVGVDGAGRIVGYLRVCSHHLDGASLYHGEADLGSWSAHTGITNFASWTLASPPRGWQAKQPLGHLLPDTEYTLYGWTSDNSSSAAGVRFTLGQLAKMPAGQVRYWPASDPHAEDYTTGSIEQFQRTACSAS